MIERQQKRKKDTIFVFNFVLILKIYKCDDSISYIILLLILCNSLSRTIFIEVDKAKEVFLQLAIVYGSQNYPL